MCATSRNSPNQFLTSLSISRVKYTWMFHISFSGRMALGSFHAVFANNVLQIVLYFLTSTLLQCNLPAGTKSQFYFLLADILAFPSYFALAQICCFLCVHGRWGGSFIHPPSHELRNFLDIYTLGTSHSSDPNISSYNAITSNWDVLWMYQYLIEALLQCN